MSVFNQIKTNKKFKNLLILLVLSTLLLFSCSTTTSAIKDEQGNEVDGSVAILEPMKIGEIDQWVLIRGESVDNPILLFLHGGPGGTEMPFVPKFNKDLEKDFIVVNWDQRGTCKSYDPKIPAETMTLDQFVEDAHELVQKLKDTYGKEKVFVIGHSWGTILGVNLVQKYPEDFYAYAGMGQVFISAETERETYKFTLNEAKRRGNKEAQEELEALPDRYWEQENAVEYISIQRDWLDKLGGSLYGQDSYDMLLNEFMGKEHNFSDLIKYKKGSLFSVTMLLDELMAADLSKDGHTVFEIPVYFFMGKHDYNTPYVLAKEYFDMIEAPKKEFFTFESSAHSPVFEEPQKFNDLMVNVVLKENY